MICAKSPHVLFRKLLTSLDELRRESIKAISSPEMKKMYGLTVRQGSAISQLKLMLEEEPEGVALKALAKRMQMTIPAASLLVESMVSKGYMVRNPNPTDRRSIRIALTEEGNALFSNVYARFDIAIDERAKALTEEELATFSRIVDIME
jgi:DNA-binding MarR family transcriptional regulator